MRILTITSCTGEKVSSPANQLTLDDFVQGGAHLKKREKELKDFELPAGEIYTGQQHVRLIRGIEGVKEIKNLKIDLHILSAGYGMIPADQVVVPYECTFATMKTKELRQWADKLQVPQDFRETVGAKYDIGLVLLGDNYLDACALDAKVKFGGPTLLFCGTGTAKTLPPMNHVRVVAISNPEAKRFSCGLVALKGELAARVLKGVANDPSVVKQLMDPSFDVLAWLDQQVSEKAVSPTNPAKTKVERSKPAAKQADAGTPKSKGSVNPKVDHVIQIPQSWWDKPHRKKLRYFIPEWDDYVDPDYDFITDTHSGGSGDWSNEVYAHQMYPEPNYDGILMSRAVAEKSKKKDARINSMGVHRYLRVPRNFPIMGDCGAFDYIEMETPPYSTEDVLDYYTRLDFDIGASVDHLVVPAFESARQFRYDLTVNNAEEFIKEHRKAKLKWEPMGSVQGWDPASYARAAADYIKMGYRYLALGGLVRCSTSEIGSILRDVKEVLPSGTNLHLFGIARPEALHQFSSLGVTSVDSASYLRRAWLVAKDNYFTLDGTSYSSLRVPGVGRSYRAKRVLASGIISENELLRLERECLAAVRGYDKGSQDIKGTVELLARYHQLISDGGPPMDIEYRRTLEAMPWKHCPCDICRRWGIEVMIFRGNNRNRRRGFHNTFVFYNLMQKALSGEKLPGSKPETIQLNLFQT
jgi:hypothetical protein